MKPVSQRPWRRRAVRRALASGLAGLLFGAGPAAAVQFEPPRTLATGIGFTAVLALGPEDPDPGSRADGCLYAAHASQGAVHRICFGADKAVTSHAVVIDLNASGGVDMLLGIAFDPYTAPSAPMALYLAYAVSNTAPFNGRIARAVSADGGVTYAVDEMFITGLPRSSFDHQTNGLAFGPDRCLYVAQGNSGNAGYDRDFAESRLSSAVLRACFLGADGEVSPTFDRTCGDAHLQEACDLEVFASGLRNPFDLVWHSNGHLYATDNDANVGFRNSCSYPANTFGCACEQPAVSPIGDELNRIEEGAYYGSPNPYRAHPEGAQCQGGSAGTDRCTTPGDACTGGGTCTDLSAMCRDSVCGAAVQCHYLGYGDPPGDGEDPTGLYRPPLLQVAALLDGVAEYRGPPAAEAGFCADWRGDLITTGAPGPLRRLQLSADGLAASDLGTAQLGGATGLDVAVGADGVIYVADLYGGRVTYLRPIAQPDTLAPDFFVVCSPGTSCVGSTCLPPDGCRADGECNDGNTCTDDACAAGVCTHVANAAACDDGLACTVGDLCADGTCAAGAADHGACTDADGCTDDRCDPIAGCTHTANTAPCDDGVACTTGDRCQDSRCAAGTADDALCDDGDPCTVESCTASGCATVPDPTLGEPCATGDAGACAAGTVRCTAGGPACVGDRGPSAELCNGVDDDCNGLTDDGDPGGSASCATAQAGACAAGGLRCVDGAERCISEVEPHVELCDTGIDEDCDGTTDEPTCALCDAEHTLERDDQTTRTTIGMSSAADGDLLKTKGTLQLPSPGLAAEGLAATVRIEHGGQVLWQSTLPPGMLVSARSGRLLRFADGLKPYEHDGLKRLRLHIGRDGRQVRYDVDVQQRSFPALSAGIAAVTIKLGAWCFRDPADACGVRSSGQRCE